MASMQTSARDEDAMDFCTLGMFIIDEIHFKPPIPSQYNILGGAGSYAAIGARVMQPPPASKRIGWIVDCGSDFPPEIRETINSWETGCLMRETPDRLTTRGWNGYGENEHRAFKYTTPKLRLDQNSLDDKLLGAKTFHLISSPERCQEMIDGISERRSKVGLGNRRSLYIWEPVPDLCIPSELDNLRTALNHVDVVSPNHGELCGFFGISAEDGDMVHERNIERCCDELLASGIGIDGKGAIVVRAGKEGCYVALRGFSIWLPSYFSDDQERVKDPTGGGNSFLGGFAVSLAAKSAHVLSPGCLCRAAVCGSVAASFAIEQVGMARLEKTGQGESWNGQSAEERVRELIERISDRLKSNGIDAESWHTV